MSYDKISQLQQLHYKDQNSGKPTSLLRVLYGSDGDQIEIRAVSASH
jgi:hypothetical protein